jgi:hypothetical protein
VVKEENINESVTNTEWDHDESDNFLNVFTEQFSSMKIAVFWVETPCRLV